MKPVLLVFYVAAALLALAGCRKDFLDTRPDKALLVPATLADMRALLDNNFVFNNTPGLTWIADGDMYTTATGYNGWSQDMERNSYTWSKDIYAGLTSFEWYTPYQQVLYANVVLEALAKLPPGAAGGPEGREVRGTALFHRAYAFYNLAQQFAAPYQAATAAALPGIPLRLSADVTRKTGRGTLRQTYAQVLADLRAARGLLPSSTLYKSRPSAVAAQALLARVCLSMEDYAQAGRYADSALTAYSTLIDYNTLSKTATRPFPRALPDGNAEVIFYSALLSYSFRDSSAPTWIDPGLYGSYDANDLRKVLFCRQITPGNYRFKGNYAGTLLDFSGLATDELYLMSAECRARAGDVAGAMTRLNTLLAARWVSGTFVPYTAADGEEALRQVLAERRKELPGRGLRWGDLRRLNSDPRFAVELTRTVGDAVFTLPPGSPRYTYPIPDEEVRLEGLAQNER
jgi:tetratricopeptide (TPR) repeat protein